MIGLRTSSDLRETHWSTAPTVIFLLESMLWFFSSRMSERISPRSDRVAQPGQGPFTWATVRPPQDGYNGCWSDRDSKRGWAAADAPPQPFQCSGSGHLDMQEGRPRVAQSRDMSARRRPRPRVGDLDQEIGRLQGKRCHGDNDGGGGGTRTRVHEGPGGVSTSLAGAFHLACQLRVGRIWFASSGCLRSRPDRADQPVPSPLATPHLCPRAQQRRRGYCLGSQCEITLGR